MGWDIIKGQDRVINLLRRGIERNRIPHAYLFVGPEGVGKKLTALSLAKTLNCSERGAEFCGVCPACHKTDTGIHPDVSIIEPEETGNLKIEQIRGVQDAIAYKPFEGRYKIWIIDQADKMTLQAANCFLKTLEEPPEHSLIILLVSNINSLLPTIISRCQRVNFSALPLKIVKELLKERGFAPNMLDLGAALSNGSMAQAQSMRLDDFWEKRKEMLDFLNNPRDLSAIFDLGEKTGKDKDMGLSFLRLLNLWFRDLMAQKLGMPEEILINQDEIPRIRQQAQKFKLTTIERTLNEIQNSFAALTYNASPRLVLETILLQIK